MPQYMLALYDTPEMTAGFMNMSPEEMQKALEKYMAWNNKPFTVRSVRLAEEGGRTMRNQGGQTRVTDGPFGETKEVLGGYYLIEAANYDEAVQRTMDHPHLEYGGIVEVRQTYGS